MSWNTIKTVNKWHTLANNDDGLWFWISSNGYRLVTPRCLNNNRLLVTISILNLNCRIIIGMLTYLRRFSFKAIALRMPEVYICIWSYEEVMYFHFILFHLDIYIFELATSKKKINISMNQNIFFFTSIENINL